MNCICLQYMITTYFTWWVMSLCSVLSENKGLSLSPVHNFPEKNKSPKNMTSLLLEKENITSYVPQKQSWLVMSPRFWIWRPLFWHCSNMSEIFIVLIFLQFTNRAIKPSCWIYLWPSLTFGHMQLWTENSQSNLIPFTFFAARELKQQYCNSSQYFLSKDKPLLHTSHYSLIHLQILSKHTRW